jgi:hypothetical protein
MASFPFDKPMDASTPIGDLRDRLKGLDDLYTRAVDASIKQATDKPDSKPVWNWPVTVLRVGIIGMLVFLTQILISLYRYNSRLIAFYSLRRNGLILAGDKANLRKLQPCCFLLIWTLAESRGIPFWK